MANLRKFNIDKFLNHIQDQIILSINELFITDELCIGYEFNLFWPKLRAILTAVLTQSISNPYSLKRQFKDILKDLMNAGVPFTNGKELIFWSSEFARREAEAFAEKIDMVTDGIAQKYFRKIFLKNGDIKILSDYVEDPKHACFIPILAKFFWEALSEFYAEQAKKGSVVTLFTSSQIDLDRIFWRLEFPILQKNNVSIMVYLYSHNDKRWENPFLVNPNLIKYLQREKNAIRISESKQGYFQENSSADTFPDEKNLDKRCISRL